MAFDAPRIFNLDLALSKRELSVLDELLDRLRASDWTVNGATLWDDYLFNGANSPSRNEDYKMAGVFAANSAGELVL